MKKTLKPLMIVLLFLTFVLTSCSPEDGADGATGPQGVAGQDGVDGSDGEDGNANIFASDWIVVDSWSTYIWLYTYSIDAPEVTQEIRNSGIVLLYHRLGEDETNGVSLLPKYIYGGRASYSLHNGGMTVVVSDPTDAPVNNIDYFRYIVIESSALASSKSSSVKKESINTQLENAGVDITNYDEVLSYFGE